MFMLVGSPVSWKSKRQTSVAFSTTEVEYYALGIACQEAAWIKQIFQELLIPLNSPIHIFSDNMGMVALSDNPIFHNRSKHIDIHWHFVQDLIQLKTISPCISLAFKMVQTSSQKCLIASNTNAVSDC